MMKATLISSAIHKLLKKYFNRSLNSRFLLGVSSRLRFYAWAKFLRLLPPTRFKRAVTILFSPNQIRKVLNSNFSEKLITVYDKSNNTSYCIDYNDEVGYQHFLNPSARQLPYFVAKQLDLNPCDIFLDIGANIGTTCIPIAKEFDMEVIAVEASPGNASLLLKNVSNNKVKAVLHLVCAVSPELSSEQKYIKLFIKNGNNGSNSIFEEWNPSKFGKGGFELARTATLDSIILKDEIAKIKLVKIDVEGAELEALKGFQSLKFVEAPIIFEYRIDRMRKDLDGSPSGLINELEKHFTLYGIILDHSNKVRLIPFEPNKAAENAIGFPKSNLEFYLKRFSDL